MGVRVRERDGAWWVFVNHQRKRKAKRIGVGEAGKKAAMAAAEKIQAKLALGDLGVYEEKPKPMTFERYADNWLKVSAEVNCKPSSVEEYEKSLRNHLKPAFGRLALSEITREKVKSFLAEKLATGSARHKGRALNTGTVQNLLVVLRAILNSAVEDGLLSANPAARLGKFAKRKDRTADDRLDVLTRSELAHLLDVAHQETPEIYPSVSTMALTGIRESELFGLQPDDVDFERKGLWIRRAIVRGRVGTPKNGKVRRVDLSSQSCHVLRGYLATRDAEAVLQGQGPSQWLFPKPTGEPMDWTYFTNHVWKPLLDRAGLRHRGPHQLRHTFASLLIAEGAHPKYIQAQLGHSSIQVTLDIYGHLFEGDHRRYVEALDAALDVTGRNPRATESVPETLPAPISSR